MNIQFIPTLKRVLKEAIISPTLRKAVQEIIKALETKNYDLATKLSVCKSYICGKINPNDTQNAFQEDNAANEELLKTTVYSILDTLNFELSMYRGSIPAGMTVITTHKNGTVHFNEEPLPQNEHPIIQRIQLENQLIRESIKPKRRKIQWIHS